MSKRFVFWITLLLFVVVLGSFVRAVQAQTSELPPLTEPGPYGVRMVSMQFVDPAREDWTVETYVWYPADKTDATPVMKGSLVLRNAPPDRSGAPYPLIIYSHGWIETNAEMLDVMVQLASHGYVVAAAQHHDADPASFELIDRPLDIMLTLNELAAISDGDLAGMIDTNNVGLMGYSLGGSAVMQMLGLGGNPVGYAAWCAEHPELRTWDCTPPTRMRTWDFAALTAYRDQVGLQNLPDGTWTPFGDTRIRAVLALAPCFYSALTTDAMLAAVTTPTLIIHDTHDELCSYETNAVYTYTHLAADDRYLISVVNQSHMIFVLNQQAGQHFATAFFGVYLKGDGGYELYLTPDHLPGQPIPELAWGVYEGE